MPTPVSLIPTPASLIPKPASFDNFLHSVVSSPEDVYVREGEFYQTKASLAAKRRSEQTAKKRDFETGECIFSNSQLANEIIMAAAKPLLGPRQMSVGVTFGKVFLGFLSVLLTSVAQTQSTADNPGAVRDQFC